MSSQRLDPVKVAQALEDARCGMTAANVQDMADRYAQQQTSVEIGLAFGLSRNTVLRLLRLSGVNIRAAHRPSIWTPEFTTRVKELRAQGRSWDETAERAGVSRTTIFKAKRLGVI